MASTLNSIIWKFSESVLSQIVSLVVSIVIARILGPEQYGIVALVIIFTTIAQVFIDGGFNSALIQKKNADDKDFSTVFYFSLIFSGILYLLLFVLAPSISEFYDNKYPEFPLVFRVLGVSIIISAINGVQTAYVQKKMMFKNFFWARFCGTSISGIVGICMAYGGFGVWALVAQTLVSSIVNTFTLFLITKKTPILVFSFIRLKGLFGFGIKVLASNLLVTIYKELRALVIGKLYSASDLALFSRASHYPSLLVSNVNSTLSSVLYPRMSLDQDDKSALLSILRRSLRLSTYTLTPLLALLAACADPFIRILLTDKWIGCVPYLQLLCVINMFQPISTINNQAINALGKSGTILTIEVIRKTIELISLLLVMRISVMAIVVNMLVMAMFLNIAYIFPNKINFSYSYLDQIKDLLPGILYSTIMFVIVYPINFVSVNDIYKISIQIVVGGITYILISKITQNPEYLYIKGVLRSRIIRK